MQQHNRKSLLPAFCAGALTLTAAAVVCPLPMPPPSGCVDTESSSCVPDNGAPCYLVCGPYKVIVTGPGTYSFPLDVCVEYTARTYPEALPMTIAYDDGYRGPQWAQSNLWARPTSAVPRARRRDILSRTRKRILPRV